MEFNFKKLKTESGVPLWILNIPTSKTVSAGVLVKAGTRDENWPKEAGIAHALEHVVFLGTEKFSTSQVVSEYIEEIGGALNAWTWKEMTFYYSQVPAEYAERSIYLTSEQLRKSTFPENKIKVEMKNIVQEIRRSQDDPSNFVERINNKFVYKDHPLAKDTLGTEESVLAFTKQDFLNFKERYYTPDNYVFIVAGNISEEEAIKLFDKHFPEKVGEKANKRASETLDLVDREQLLIQKKDIEQVHMILSVPTCSSDNPDSQYLSFFKAMISGGMSFPLFQEVRDKLGLCYTIVADIVKWSDVGIFEIYIGTDPKRYDEAVQAIFKVIADSKSDKVLFEKTKSLIKGRLNLKYENTSNIINIAAQDIAFTGVPKGYEKTIEEIEKIKIEEVGRVVDKYLKPEQFFKTMLVPENFKEK